MGEEKKEKQAVPLKGKTSALNKGMVFGFIGLYALYVPSTLQWLFQPWLMNSQLAFFSALVITFIGMLYLLNAF